MIEGARSTGIVTTEPRDSGPPSSDLAYILPDAGSAVSRVVPIDRKTIPSYLPKKDRLSYEQEYMRVRALTGRIVHGIPPGNGCRVYLQACFDVMR